MMNISGDEAKKMSLEEYEARLFHWNEAHEIDVEPPDPEVVMPLLDRINADPRLTH